LNIWSFASRTEARPPSSSAPFGRFVFALARAVFTSSRPMPCRFRAVGLSSTRTAGSELPPTVTSPTPSIWAIFCARIVEAAS